MLKNDHKIIVKAKWRYLDAADFTTGSWRIPGGSSVGKATFLFEVQINSWKQKKHIKLIYSECNLNTNMP